MHNNAFESKGHRQVTLVFVVVTIITFNNMSITNIIVKITGLYNTIHM